MEKSIWLLLKKTVSGLVDASLGCYDFGVTEVLTVPQVSQRPDSKRDDRKGKRGRPFLLAYNLEVKKL